MLGKRYGNRERLVACHLNLQVGTTRIFIGKHKELAGLVMRVIQIYSQMKARRNLYGIHDDFFGVGGGLRRCILIRNRDWGGIGVLASTCTCFMKLMLRHGWVGTVFHSSKKSGCFVSGEDVGGTWHDPI